VKTIDEFATLEESKHFLEKHEATNSPAYLHAALNLAFCSLEAHVNAIAEEFMTRLELTAWDRAVLSEKAVELNDGEYSLTTRLKMHRLEDRVLYLCRRFSKKPIDRKSKEWSQFKTAIQLRNELTHPKNALELTHQTVSNALSAVIEILDVVYRALYRRGYPHKYMRLASSLSF
jgi:hypothetical protein